MERFEMAELLSSKAGVTLEEARQALADNEWDMLDAMIALERRGRTVQPQPVVVGGGPEPGAYSVPAQTRPVTDTAQKDPVLTNGFAELWGYIKKFFRLLVDTIFTVSRRDRVLMSFPVIWLVLLLICCFWVTLPAMIIGLFFGCKYRFDGRSKASDAANKAMESFEDAVDEVRGKAGDSAGKAKESFEDAVEDLKSAFGKN